MVGRTVLTLVGLAVLAALLLVMLALELPAAEIITILVLLTTLMVILGGLGLQAAKELRSSHGGSHRRAGPADRRSAPGK